MVRCCAPGLCALTHTHTHAIIRELKTFLADEIFQIENFRNLFFSNRKFSKSKNFKVENFHLQNLILGIKIFDS